MTHETGEIIKMQSIKEIMEDNPTLGTMDALALQHEQTGRYLAGVSETLGLSTHEIHEMGGEQVGRLLTEATIERQR